MLYKKGMKVKSLTTNTYRKKGEIITITENSNDQIVYRSSNGNYIKRGDPQEFEIINESSSQEESILDSFKYNEDNYYV